MVEPDPLASTANSMQPSAQNVSTGNLAVARCAEIYERSYKSQIVKGEHKVFAAEAASRLYRAAMPAPIGRDGIRDFVACVAYGVLIRAIDAKDSKVLLYAAQVAQSALREAQAPASKSARPLKDPCETPGGTPQ